MLVSHSSSFQNQNIEETDSIGCPNETDNTVVVAASASGSAFVFLIVGIGVFVHFKTKTESFHTIWHKSLMVDLLDEWSGLSPDAHTGTESGIHVSNLTAGDFASDAGTGARVRTQNVTGS